MNKDMKADIKLFLIFVIYTLFCVFLGYHIRQNDNKTKVNVIVTDTIYNKHIIDSIQYDINKIETTIVDIKRRCDYEKEQSLNDSDSDAVKRFLELAWSDD